MKHRAQGIPDSIAPYCRDYNALLLVNHGAGGVGGSLMGVVPPESTGTAMVIMYTGKHRQGQCAQLRAGGRTDEIRKKMGITSGGIPPCTAKATNTVDVVVSRGGRASRPQDIRPARIALRLRGRQRRSR